MTSSPSRAQTPSTAAIGAGEVKLTVQLPTPAIHGPNQPLKWNPIALLKLFDPSAPSSPHWNIAAGDSPRRKSQRRRPSVLFSSARDPKLKEPKLPGVKLQNVLKLQNSEL